tara:strand:+ start:172 stop:456 length:285 start_codon:yes stop_codon:yes gene_type:complete
MYSVRQLDERDIRDIMTYEGKMFSDNFSATGSSLCLSIDVESNKVYYQECYSRYSNFTGKNIKGDPRTDKLRRPTPGLNTMSLSQFYGAAIGWI